MLAINPLHLFAYMHVICANMKVGSMSTSSCIFIIWYLNILLGNRNLHRGPCLYLLTVNMKEQPGKFECGKCGTSMRFRQSHAVLFMKSTFQDSKYIHVHVISSSDILTIICVQEGRGRWADNKRNEV